VLGHWICLQLFWETAWNGTGRGIITDRCNERYNFRNANTSACNGIWVLELMGFLIICSGAFFGLRAAAREAQNLDTRATIIAVKLLLLPLFVWIDSGGGVSGVRIKYNDKNTSIHRCCKNKSAGQRV
jgi:hypothetical protein